MILSMKWISEFVDLSGVDIKDLIHRVTLSTAEVEDIYEKGRDIEKVVVGKIISMKDHQDSKKLHILEVDNGQGVLDCVCGASNIFVGAKVPFANVGGKVGGLDIKSVEVANVLSNGMCCSEKELGISDRQDGVMILDDSLEVGREIKEYFDIEDILFEVDNKSLTNRPDLWGHYGMAREIAALTHRELKPLESFDTTKFDSLDKIKVFIEREDKVFRYSCIRIDHITKNVSSVNMRIRLSYCGMRVIHLLADLTNYVMLELGQPMHAFDCTKVNAIRVKTFDHPFNFTTLDDIDREIDPEVLMICNHQTPIAIAGIMGGKESEVEDATNSILLESANFEGVSIRKSGTRLGLRTDASARYEKILDPELTTVAIQRFLHLLTVIDPEAKITSALTDVYVKKYDKVMIHFDKAFVDKYTGIDISKQQIEATLLALDFGVEKKGSEYVVTVPTHRATKDVTTKVDIIEEITRIYGYDNFELKSTQSLLAPIHHQAEREVEYEMKQALATKYGMNEIHSYIWYDSKMNKKLGIEADSKVRIINSLTAENDTIRSTMAPTLLCYVKKNITSFGDVNLFEVGRVAKGINVENLVDERKILAGVLSSKGKGSIELIGKAKEIVDYITFLHKNVSVEYVPADKLEYNWVHRKNSAIIKIAGVEVGYITLVTPRISNLIDKRASIVLFEFDYPLFSEIPMSRKNYQEPSKYPGTEMDISVILGKEDNFKRIQDVLETMPYEYLLGYKLVDIFIDEKALEDKKSVTIRLDFGSDESTLLREEIMQYMDKLLKAFEAQGICLRS